MFRISCVWLKPGPEFWALTGNCFEPSVLEDLWNTTGKAGFGCPWLILEPCRCVLRNKPDTALDMDLFLWMIKFRFGDLNSIFFNVPFPYFWSKPLLVLREPHTPLHAEGICQCLLLGIRDELLKKYRHPGAKDELSQQLPASLRKEKSIYQG